MHSHSHQPPRARARASMFDERERRHTVYTHTAASGTRRWGASINTCGEDHPESERAYRHSAARRVLDYICTGALRGHTTTASHRGEVRAASRPRRRSPRAWWWTPSGGRPCLRGRSRTSRSSTGWVRAWSKRVNDMHTEKGALRVFGVQLQDGE